MSNVVNAYLKYIVTHRLSSYQAGQEGGYVSLSLYPESKTVKGLPMPKFGEEQKINDALNYIGKTVGEDLKKVDAQPNKPSLEYIDKSKIIRENNPNFPFIGYEVFLSIENFKKLGLSLKIDVDKQKPPEYGRSR